MNPIQREPVLMEGESVYGANQERTNAEFDADVIGCSDLEVCAVAMLQHLIRKHG